MRYHYIRQFSVLVVQVIFIFGVACRSDALTLNLNHQFPEDAAGSKLDLWFADEVARITGGELKIQIFWSNALGEAKENLILLRTNAFDMAAMSPGYFPDELPLFSAPNSIPMGLDNVCQASRISQVFLDKIPAFREEAARNGVRLLFFHVLNPYLLVSKSPVTRFSDLKGMKIRTWGEDMPKLIRSAGGIPVSLFLPDIYDTLKNGVIDGLPFSTDLMVSYKIYELARHVTEVVMWQGPSWGIWISEKSWQRLSESHQSALTEAAQKARNRDVPITIKADEQARAFLKNKGVRFHSFPEEELAKWRQANPDFFAVLKMKLEQKGCGSAAEQMIEIWEEIRADKKCP